MRVGVGVGLGVGWLREHAVAAKDALWVLLWVWVWVVGVGVVGCGW